jgi:ribonuclease P protein component
MRGISRLNAPKGAHERDETDLPAESTEAEADARVSGSYEEQGGTACPQAAASEGTKAAGSLIRMAQPRGTAALPRSERLRAGRAFQAVFQRGNRVERPSLVVVWRSSNGRRQVGFAASRQVRGAVRRNRVRRRLREAYRNCRPTLPEGIQFVCVGRESAGEGPFIDLRRDMESALRAVAKQHRAAHDQ